MHLSQDTLKTHISKSRRLVKVLYCKIQFLTVSNRNCKVKCGLGTIVKGVTKWSEACLRWNLIPAECHCDTVKLWKPDIHVITVH